MFLEFDALFAPAHLPTGLTIDLQRQHVVGTKLNQRQRRTIVNNTALENIVSARLAASSEVIASPAM